MRLRVTWRPGGVPHGCGALSRLAAAMPGRRQILETTKPVTAGRARLPAQPTAGTPRPMALPASAGPRNAASRETIPAGPSDFGRINRQPFSRH